MSVFDKPFFGQEDIVRYEYRPLRFDEKEHCREKLTPKQAMAVGRSLEPSVVLLTHEYLRVLDPRPYFDPDRMRRLKSDKYGNDGQPYFVDDQNRRPLDGVVSLDLRPEGAPWEDDTTVRSIFSIEATITSDRGVLYAFMGSDGRLPSETKVNQVNDALSVRLSPSFDKKSRWDEERFPLDGVIVAMLNPIDNIFCLKIYDRGPGVTRFGCWGQEVTDRQITHRFGAHGDWFSYHGIGSVVFRLAECLASLEVMLDPARSLRRIAERSLTKTGDE